LKLKNSKAPLACGEGPGVRFFGVKISVLTASKILHHKRRTLKLKNSKAPLACGEGPGVRFFGVKC
jgi:hypothetical protein